MTVRASVVMPVLVVPDDMLWAVDYAADGTLVEGPQRVGEVNLYLGKSVRTKFLAYDLTHMPVMTFGKFSTYLDDLLSKGGSWSNLFPDESFLRMYERDGLSWRV
ncbi:MAG: hypothetical protein EOP06_30920 [Proteobacteria bacterium]|nr:MAG: hypothetical protein EOP06_30920 [Pseudomonadota bacterium]